MDATAGSAVGPMHLDGCKAASDPMHTFEASQAQQWTVCETLMVEADFLPP